MSQNDEILAYLKAGNSLTTLEALPLFGTMNLRSRLSDLKKQGHQIAGKPEKKNGKTYFRYYYIGELEIYFK